MAYDIHIYKAIRSQVECLITSTLQTSTSAAVVDAQFPHIQTEVTYAIVQLTIFIKDAHCFNEFRLYSQKQNIKSHQLLISACFVSNNTPHKVTLNC